LYTDTENDINNIATFKINILRLYNDTYKNIIPCYISLYNINIVDTYYKKYDIKLNKQNRSLNNSHLQNINLNNTNLNIFIVIFEILNIYNIINIYKKDNTEINNTKIKVDINRYFYNYFILVKGLLEVSNP
jgi:hypothetical protein